MRWISFAFVTCLLLGVAASAPDEKRLSIYSPVANYSLNLTERDGRDYVGLLEILEPLGTVSARTEGRRWRLRFNETDAQFAQGNVRARIHGRDVDLPARFLLENGRGLVPVDSLATLLPHFLGIPVVFHVTARRLFISEAGTTYTAEFSKTTPPKLFLNFSSAVNPTIATEPGKLHMVFVRDPLVTSGPEVVNFDNKTIASSTFQENNGAAEITIAGDAPLLASFSNDGRTITIAPAPVAAAPTPAAAPGAVSPATVPGGTASPSFGARRYFAVVDASHGGDDRGATFNERLTEKDVALAFARGIRQELENRGIPTLVLRDGDVTLSLDQRASMTNATHPAIYISVHVANDGAGIRVYTALMPTGGESRGPFAAWDSAQSAFLGFSQTAASGIAAELRKQLPVRVLAAPLRPLNNVTTAAVAVEVAPQAGDINELTSSSYQLLVVRSVAIGVANVRDKLEVSH